MYSKILVPLDGSDVSECSLAHVRAISLGCGVPDVVFLKVVEPVFNQEAEATARVGKDLMAQVEEENRQKDIAYLEGVAARFNAEGIHASTALGHGKPDEQITEFCRQHNVDLIIMSTHGRSGFKHLILGSVTEKVIRHSPVPVLTVVPCE